MTYRTCRSLILSLSLPALLCACASAPQRPEGQIEILTTAQGTPLSGAECTVDTASGSWKVVTPAIANVGEPRGDLRVVCNRAGYRSSEVQVRVPGSGYVPGSTRVGVGVGGGTWGSHSGLGISLGFGFPLGGASPARYPAQVLVDMTPQPDGQTTVQPQQQPQSQSQSQPRSQPVPQTAPQNKHP
jgi:hypothetical protein